MDLTPQFLRDSLHRVDLDGWDSAAGRQLLDHVRSAVVVPVVRRSGLRGPAAEQAEASGWEAAWDALRRPTARTAENPGGMVWVAVRRAVAAECGFTRHAGPRPVAPVLPGNALPGNASPGRVDTQWAGPSLSGHAPAVAQRATPEIATQSLSLEALMDVGWQPADTACALPEDPGPLVSAVLEMLVLAGWERAEAEDAIAIMADHAMPARSGSPTTRWRWVSLRLGVPEWQARRLAALLLGGGGWPGVLALAVQHGSWVTDDPAVRAAVRSTTVRWGDGPGSWLAGWDARLGAIA